MNEVLITGGTGHLGKLIVQFFRNKNHPVRVLTTKPLYLRENLVEYYRGDLVKNENLANAVKGVNTLIHCASNPKDFESTDVIGTRHLLEAAKDQGVEHFIYISIVGVDKSDYPYYVAKYKAEQLIVNSGIPYTIVRATQFHNFLLNIIQSVVEENASKD